MPNLNPFARRTAALDKSALAPDATTSAGSLGGDLPRAASHERLGKAPSLMNIGGRKSQDTGDYKMSGVYRNTACLTENIGRLLTTPVVNDSGVYLPPSPTAAPCGGRILYRRGSSSSSRSGTIEPFSISRESFDSYRRSFDISARSPVLSGMGAGGSGMRHSLDLPATAAPRSTPRGRRSRFPPADEGFEDVDISGDGAAAGDGSTAGPGNLAAAFLRRRGALFRFGGRHAESGAVADTAPYAAAVESEMKALGTTTTTLVATTTAQPS